ncbi:cytochrome oxidase (cbb3-type) [Rhodopirellula maiorica SM1]|uniref:Cytochrome oxidase (Cbb3-type) n=1 Tax=Rhodopirellula maiorica SM1 TaxID=1265738 RepID=M5RBE6_9BACT|nr:c-type cytochrome [Rhodopirellula maiorica]EMI16381.1 cytochrome oxidase (cbb3-type) [Rhodopirellula maiorica SM1]
MRSLFICIWAATVAWTSASAAEGVRPDADSRHASSAPPMVAGFDRFARHGDIDAVDGGRLLLGELSCTACHASGAADPETNATVSAITPKRGPRLHSAGRRYSQAWLADFIATPHQVKPGTTMPHLLENRSPQQRREIGHAIAAFLVDTQRADYPEIKATGANPVMFEFWKRGDADRGSEIFHTRGCVACHSSDADYVVAGANSSPVDTLLDELDPEELADMGLAGAARRVDSIPLGDLAAKYSRKSLAHFLHDPAHTRPALRMPDFKLSSNECADLAEYLLSAYSSEKLSRGEQTSSEQSSDKAANDAALVQRGRELFSELNCAACHDSSIKSAVARAKPLSAVNLVAANGCLGNSPQRPVQYSLDSVQRDAIAKAIESAKSGQPVSAKQKLDGILLASNCYGCHQRDELGGIGRYRKPYFETTGHIDLGDEGRLPPPLTGVGAKLTSTHLTNVVSGKTPPIRPYMQIQMPRFSQEVAHAVPKLFAKVDGVNTADAARVFGDTKDLADVGRELMDIGCVQCHTFAGNALPGVMGVDLSKIHSRIHPAWFEEFLLNPGGVKARTRMPTFFVDGKSPRPDLFDGDPKRQIAAMWAYLSELPKHPLPSKIEKSRADNYELAPTDQPLILRTFMPGAGTHAIAVGFPEQVHFAFDAEQVRLATIWRGRFLDAQGTWFVRFAPPAVPLGQAVVEFVEGFSFAKLDQANQAWPTASDVRFGGYRLDHDHSPVFLYDYAGLEITDRVEPLTSGNPPATHQETRLRRTLTLTSIDSAANTNPPPLWFRVHRGDRLTQINDHTMQNEAGVTIALPTSIARDAELFRGDDVTEWRLPVREFPFTIEVDYSW